MSLVITLFVTADRNGCVWTMGPTGPPRSAGMGVIEFVTNLTKDGINERLAIPGGSWNAELLRLLGQARNHGPAVYISSPNEIVPSQRADCGRMLRAMRSSNHLPPAPAAGGLHRMTEQDAAQYDLVWLVKNCVRDSRGEFRVEDRPALQAAYHNHPIWVPASFLAEIDWLALIDLLAIWIDPRWYSADKDELNQEFGLWPRKGEPTARMKDEVRAKLVRRVWDTVASSEGSRLSAFLKRLYMELRREGDSDAKAANRVSRTLIQYLHWNWLGAIYPAHASELFCHEVFFCDDDVAAAYLEHRAVNT